MEVATEHFFHSSIVIRVEKQQLLHQREFDFQTDTQFRKLNKK